VLDEIYVAASPTDRDFDKISTVITLRKTSADVIFSTVVGRPARRHSIAPTVAAVSTPQDADCER